MNKNAISTNEGHHGSPMSETRIPPKKCRSRFVWGLIVFLILLGIFIVREKFLWHTIDAIKGRQAIEQAAIGKLQQQVLELRSELEIQKKSLDEFSNQTKISRINWVYAGVGYLVQQAIYQIRLNNFDAARLLLGDALDALSTMPSPEVRAIENELLRVQEAIKTAKNPDQSALLNEVERLKQQVPQLPLKLPGTNYKAQNPTSARESFKQAWGELKQLIVIRHHEKPVEPLVAPSEAVYLRQNLNLQLEQASLAILYRDPALYKFSLEKVKTWVRQFFDLRAKQTQAFLENVNKLEQTNIMPIAPNVKVFDLLESSLAKLKILEKLSSKTQQGTHEYGKEPPR